jgi:hypothetical protein
MDGVLAMDRTGWLDTQLRLNGHTIDFPNMIDAPDRGCATSGSYSYDDIYVDFTRARVEISLEPLWSATKKKEVQIPVRWTDTSIELRINAGEFTSGTSAYLYVVDSSATANEQGFPITIGAGSTVRPMAPILAPLQ